MKMSEGIHPLHLAGIFLLAISLVSCTALSNRQACSFAEPVADELLRGRLQHLEIVDAETGEVAIYDSLGNPVLEGGQPLALWAEFGAPTQVGICVKAIDDGSRPLHLSEVTFSEEIKTQPLGRYDLGSYLLYLSMNGTLLTTIEFNVR